MFIGIDQSLRSTAVVSIEEDGELLAFQLVAPPKEVNNEELIRFQWSHLNSFISVWSEYNAIQGIAFEGLSFNAKGSSKDLLAGLLWYLRVRLSIEYGKIPVGVIPVTAWRKSVLTEADKKVLKAFKVKDGLKKFTVDKLPYEVKTLFEKYILDNNYKKESLYDLADAYFIAQYRRSLED